MGTVGAVYHSAGSLLKAGTPSQSKTIGSLVSVEKIPEMAGEFCETDSTASRQEIRTAALEERQEFRAASLAARAERFAAPAPAGAGPDSKDLSKLKPLRWIRDPYAAYSSIAVDPVNNEVVMTDENLFQILVYDRLENTPPKAKLSEPKRVIAGLNTKIEFQCGLYIDPRDGSIYAVNNDTVDSLVIFDRKAKGDVKPNRELNTPHGTFGVAVDEKAQEMYLTLQHDSAMVVFNKYAERDESPLRLLQGDKTGLADPHGVALDTKNGWVFITNHGAVSDRHPRPEGQRGRRGALKQNWPLERAQAVPGSGRSLPPSIIVHGMKDQGNVPPIRVIQGPKTQFDWPTGLAVDEERGELYVANDIGNSILVFNVTDSGDVAPKRVITGPKTSLRNPTGVWVDAKNHEVWAANFMNHSATVYSLDASGDVPPLRMIRSGPLNEPSLGIGNPHPLAYDSKREQILVPN
jgi:DNA-binding beta-propeller fold protein YncE